MRPKGFPACVLFSCAIAASLIGMGRVALCSLHAATMSPSSIAAPRLASLTSGLKPRPPGSNAAFRLNLTPGPWDLRGNCNSDTSAAEAAPLCGADVVTEATTYKATLVRTPPSVPDAAVPGTSVSRPVVPATYPQASAVSANFSLPITFEPAGGAAGRAVQYVGRGKGMTVLLESGGIEIVAGSGAEPNATPSSVQLRLVSSGAAQSTASGTPRNAGPSAPTRHRRRLSGATSKPRTLRRRKRQNMPCRNTSGHKGQAPSRSGRQDNDCPVRQNPPASWRRRRRTMRRVEKISCGKV